MNKKVFEGIIRGREKLEEAYKGLDISPFKPFSKEDYYAYSACEFPNGDEPLIYEDSNVVICICPEDEGSFKCDIDVMFNDDTTYAMGDLSFVKALKLGLQVVNLINNNPLIDVYEFLEDNGFDEL